MPIIQLPIRVEGRDGSAGKAGIAVNTGEPVAFAALTLDPGIKTFELKFSADALEVQVQSLVNEKMYLGIDAPDGKTSFVAKVTIWQKSIITLMPPTGTAIREKADREGRIFYVQVPLVAGIEAMLIETPPSL